MKFLIALLAVAMANQGVLFNVPEKVHPMTQAILGLSQLASKDFDFQQLFVALDELAASFQERKTEENELYEREYQQYLADQQYYSNQIVDFEGKIAQLEVEIKDLTESRNYAQGYLGEKKGELYDTIKILNQKQNQINNDESTFNKQNSEYSDTIAILDEALALLSEVRDAQTLIQRKEHLKAAGDKMHSHFRQLKSRRVFYQPLVKALNQLTQNNYVDQEALKKVIDYMNDLRNSLVGAQVTLQNEYNSQSAIQRDILAAIQAKVNDLRDVQIPDIQKDIENKDSELKALNAILADARQNLADAQESLNQTNNRWIERTKSHNELIQQYDNELLTIKEAENSLKKGGIFRK